MHSEHFAGCVHIHAKQYIIILFSSWSGVYAIYISCLQLSTQRGSGRFVPTPPFCDYVYDKIRVREKV